MTEPSKIPALQSYPQATLGHGATPLELAPALGAELGVELFIKRDDCTGLAFGGNKVRQLEFYLGAARASGADVVLITGAVQSNFVRLAAAGARRLGMDIHIQLEERVGDPDPTYRTSGNVLLDRVFGATLHSFPVGEDEAAADDRLETIADSLTANGASPYVIHLGLDHPPIGALGYVKAAAELTGQFEHRSMAVDAVVVPSGSALTHSGLLVGLRACGLRLPVFGICVRRDAAQQHPRVLDRSREVATLIERPGLISEDDVHVTDTALGPGYGKIDETTYRMIHLAARLEGLLLDPVYSAKAMAGLAALIDAGTIRPGARVVFVHTGGQPALFGYQEKLEPFLSSG